MTNLTPNLNLHRKPNIRVDINCSNNIQIRLDDGLYEVGPHVARVDENCSWRSLVWGLISNTASFWSPPMSSVLRPYPSDLSEEEWQVLTPLIPPPKPGGRPRKWPMQRILNAGSYVVK